MTPLDERHGTIAGYVAGCSCEACRDAKYRYEKRRSHEYRQGRPRKVDATGTRRRVQALVAIGWSTRELSAMVDKSEGWIRQPLYGRQWVLTSTRDTIRDLYDRLHMTPGPSVRARNYAKRRGWVPPLEWDNIDDPQENPFDPDFQVLVDEVLVQRALDGQRVKANTAEKREIVRQWLRRGRPLSELDRVQGWRSTRYKEAV